LNASVPRRIALIAGEASGDLLGEGLVRALRERWPDAELKGIGGPRMVAAGFDSWFAMERLSVMGLVEVLKHLPGLLRLRRELVARLVAWRPDVVVGIDAPDFNLGVERRVKAHGIRTVHYVSPSVWAWREGRAAKLGASADLVLCLFPMEPPIYERHGVAARFVGHPLADRFPDVPDRGAARDALGLPRDARVLALLPGSRAGEIARLGPVFLAACERLLARVPGLRIVAPMANARRHAQFRQLLDASAARDAVTVLDGRPHESMVAADAVLLASGTAALEAMLAKRAMVVAYKLAPLTHWLVRTFGLMRIDRYSLPNVLAGETLVPELMQQAATPDAIADATAQALDPATEARLLPRFAALHETLRRGADREAANAIAALVERKP
jgi:lipid-A-disaccharide synthase